MDCRGIAVVCSDWHVRIRTNGRSGWGKKWGIIHVCEALSPPHKTCPSHKTYTQIHGSFTGIISNPSRRYSRVIFLIKKKEEKRKKEKKMGVWIGASRC